ncbi:MAG: hypothetical protein ACE5MH_09235 [Terriglobia bacterium]
MNWQLLLAQSGIAFFRDVVILLVGLVGLWQLLEWRKVRRLQAMTAVNERLQRGDVRRARRTVYNLPDDATPDDAAHWPDEAKWDAELVCSSFELVGLLAAEDVVPTDWVARNWRFAIVHSWERAEPLIQHYRQTRARDYWHYFERLVRRARKLAPATS